MKFFAVIMFAALTARADVASDKVHVLLQMASNGNVRVQNALAWQYMRSTNAVEAMRWWRIAAEQGYSAAALNLGEGERLSNAAVSHAVLNFALPDEKLVNSILSLSQQDYDLLLSDANMIDQENGGYELATALGALRGATELMQTVSQAGQAAIE